MMTASDFDSRACYEASMRMALKKSKWACFPAGPLERQFEEGVQGGIVREEVHDRPSRRSEYLAWVGHIRGSLC
jgi:hypothetical protein